MTQHAIPLHRVTDAKCSSARRSFKCHMYECAAPTGRDSVHAINGLDEGGESRRCASAICVMGGGGKRRRNVDVASLALQKRKRELDHARYGMSQRRGV